jgi:hypothetical protein
MGGPEALIPFTGYLDLAIAANGRAVDALGNAVTILTDPGATPDSRVSVALKDGRSPDKMTQQKYTAADQPNVLINWMEMRLIEAEANTGNAVAMVDRVRAVDPTLPQVTYALNPDEIENMIFEERRRALWLEGRFWSTKIKNQKATGTKLWFPRELVTGSQAQETPLPEDNDLTGGVRLRMQSSEFDQNPNFTRTDRATQCGPYQRPVAETTLDLP